MNWSSMDFGARITNMAADCCKFLAPPLPHYSHTSAKGDLSQRATEPPMMMRTSCEATSGSGSRPNDRKPPAAQGMKRATTGGHTHTFTHTHTHTHTHTRTHIRTHIYTGAGGRPCAHRKQRARKTRANVFISTTRLVGSRARPPHGRRPVRAEHARGKAAATPFAFLWHGHTRPLAAKPYKKRKDIQLRPT